MVKIIDDYGVGGEKDYFMWDMPLRNQEEIGAIIALWRSVIHRQIMDARNGNKNAKLWLTIDSPSLREICSAADIDHNYMIKKAKELFENKGTVKK